MTLEKKNYCIFNFKTDRVIHWKYLCTKIPFYTLQLPYLSNYLMNWYKEIAPTLV